MLLIPVKLFRTKALSFTVTSFATFFLVGCGVDNGSFTTNNGGDTSLEIPQQAALKLLNDNRTTCGFGALVEDQNLANTATNHANYLKLVSQSNALSFASHYERAETLPVGKELVNTGITNPYYSGLTVKERLQPTLLGSSAIQTNYQSNGYSENLAMSTTRTNLNNYKVNKAQTAKAMLMGLFAAPYHIKGLVVPQFSEVGIDYQQAKWSANANYYYGNILALVSALPAGNPVNQHTELLNFPCEGVVTAYQLDNEEPNPFGTTRDLANKPIGQPLYILAPSGKTIQTVTVDMTHQGQSVGYIHVLNADNDPNKLLATNEVVAMPDKPLQPSTKYHVNYNIGYTDGTSAQKSFSFTTKADD